MWEGIQSNVLTWPMGRNRPAEERSHPMIDGKERSCLFGGFPVFEQTENRGTAPGHAGIKGTLFNHLRFQGGEKRMPQEDHTFKIIDKCGSEGVEIQFLKNRIKSNHFWLVCQGDFNFPVCP
jgi:hypothetical protein